MDTEQKTASSLLYLLGGIAAGVALGLLLAPKSGEELRADIAEFGRNMRERSRKLRAEIEEGVSGGVAAAVDATKHKAAEKICEARDKVANAVKC